MGLPISLNYERIFQMARNGMSVANFAFNVCSGTSKLNEKIRIQLCVR